MFFGGFFYSYKQAQGKSAFFSLLTLAFYSHHLPHVALADNRLEEESDERKVRETQGCDERGKASGETQKYKKI